MNCFPRQDVSSSSIGLADPGPPPGARAKLRTDSETGYGEEDTGTSGDTWGTVTLSDVVTNTLFMTNDHLYVQGQE